MNKKAACILILILLLGYALIVGIIFMVKEEPNDNPDNNGSNIDIDNDPVEITYDYLEINNIIQLRNNGGIWSLASNEEFDEVLFDIYVNKTFFGNYYLKKGVNWNIFDENNNYIDYEGDLVAGTSGLKMNVRNNNISVVDSIDLQEASTILENNIDMMSLSTNQKVMLDLDSNGIMDKVISLSNIFSEIDQSVYFNLLYVNLNGEIIVLEKELVNSANILVSPTYRIGYFINLLDSQYDSIFIQKGYFSNAGETTYLIYEYTDNTYSLTFDGN